MDDAKRSSFTAERYFEEEPITPERMSVEEFILRTSPREPSPMHILEQEPKSAPEVEPELELGYEPKIEVVRQLVFPSVPEKDVHSSSQISNKSKNSNKKGRKGCKNSARDMKDFSELVHKNLEAWKFGNVALLETKYNHVEIGLPVNFWAMNQSVLNFPATLNSKHRHVIHEICEELNLKHVSSGTVTERAVSVFKEEVAEGHNLSRAVYGSMHYEDGVKKQQHEAYLRKASPCEREETRRAVSTLAAGGDVIDRLPLYESRNVHLESLAAVPPLSQENMVLVENEHQLEMAAHTLHKAERVGFDAEWHSYRSYFGVSCLLQLTAGDGVVFVVDCLACWGSIKRYLGPLFEDPLIIKVGLALQQDVQFLLRDFGIVTRGAFDLQIAIKFTEQASNVGYAGALALCGCDPTVLEKVEASKSNVRVADWRRRPLTAEMLQYASNDCYYLLPCHDILADRLAKMWGLQGAITGSEGMVHDALRAALDKAVFRVTDWRKNKGFSAMKELVTKEKRGQNRHKYASSRNKFARQPNFGPVNEKVLEALYSYREHEAWEHDESLNFIASADLLFHLSWKLPVTSQAMRDVISAGSLGFPERDLSLTRPPPSHDSHYSTPTIEAQLAACAPWVATVKSTLDVVATEGKVGEVKAEVSGGMIKKRAYWGLGVMWGVIGASSALFMLLRAKKKW